MNEDLTIKAISTYNANLHRGMTAALEAVVAMALDEAARVAEYVPAAMVASADPYASRYIEGNKTIAAAIRALKEKPNG